MHFIRRQFLSLMSNERGSTIVIVAAAMFIMIVAVGVAVDMSRVDASQSRLASALDAAGLAAGASLSPEGACGTAPTTNSTATMDTCLSKVANNYFKANYPSGYMSTTAPILTAKLIPNNGVANSAIQLTANMKEVPSFMAIAGVKNVPVNVYTEIGLPPPPKCATPAPSYIAPTNLCTEGTSTTVNGNQHTEKWTWTCEASAGRKVDCSSDLKGQCATVAPTSTRPALSPPQDMCSSGAPVYLTSKTYNNGINEQWGWVCQGTGGNNSPSVCTAELKGECNATTTAETATSKAPSGILNLCSSDSGTTNAGTPTAVTTITDPTTGRPSWSWNCDGTSDNDATCQSKLLAQCGTAENTPRANIPPVGGNTLCSPGVATIVGVTTAVDGHAVSGVNEGPWKWTCYGSNDFDDAKCGAPLIGTCADTAPGACTTGTGTKVDNSGAPTDAWYCDGSASERIGDTTIDAGANSAKCTGKDGVCGTALNTCSTKGAASSAACPGTDSDNTSCWTCPPVTSDGEKSPVCSYTPATTTPSSCVPFSVSLDNSCVLNGAPCWNSPWADLIDKMEAAGVADTDPAITVVEVGAVCGVSCLWGGDITGDVDNNLKSYCESCKKTANNTIYPLQNKNTSTQTYSSSGTYGSDITWTWRGEECTQAPGPSGTATKCPAAIAISRSCAPPKVTCPTGTINPVTFTDKPGSNVTTSCSDGSEPPFLTSGGPWTWRCGNETCEIKCASEDGGPECNGNDNQSCAVWTYPPAVPAGGVYGTGDNNNPDNAGSVCSNSGVDSYEGAHGCAKDSGTVDDVNYTCQSAGYAGPAKSNGGNAFFYIDPLIGGTAGPAPYMFILLKNPTPLDLSQCVHYQPSGPFSSNSNGAFYICEQKESTHPIAGVYCTNSPSTCEVPAYFCPATTLDGVTLPNAQPGATVTGSSESCDKETFTCGGVPGSGDIGAPGWRQTNCYINPN